MTSQEILNAIAASNTLQVYAAVRNDAAIAVILSAGRTKTASRFTSARGVLEKYPAGPVAADALLTKLETYAAAGQPLSSLVKRANGFLSQPDGLDLGSPATLAMIDALLGYAVITQTEHDGLTSICTVADPISVYAVSAALNGV
jgi:hypothetical protein